MYDILLDIKCQVLVLIGANSDLVTPDTINKMENTVPKLEAVVVDGTGHMIPQDVPDTFELLVRNFLEKKMT